MTDKERDEHQADLEKAIQQQDFQINHLNNLIENLEMRVKDRENKIKVAHDLLAKTQPIIADASAKNPDAKRVGEAIAQVLNG